MHPRPTDINTKALLQRLTAKVCTLEKNTDGVEALLQALKNLLSGTILQETYDYIGPGNTGTIGAGLKAYSIQNTGSTDALIDGKILPPGSLITNSGEKGDVFTGLSYDTQLTTLMITTIA